MSTAQVTPLATPGTTARQPSACPPFHVLLAGPIAGDDVKAYLHPGQLQGLPAGYLGAPLTGVLIGELLRLGLRVTAVTFDVALPAHGGVVVRVGPNFSFQVCPARPRAWRNNGWRLGRMVDCFAFERAQIREQMLAAAPDLVHAHWSYEFALAALAQPAPHLITCHDAPAVVLHYNRNAYRATRYLMARQVFKRGKAFTTVSDYMAQALAPALGHEPQVIANPVSPQVLRLGHDRAAPATRRVAMVCNGWSAQKNPEPGLRGFAAWRQREPAAELHLYGADFGPGETAEKWARGHALAGGVHFHGRLPHGQLLQHMARADVLLHTALEESFGVVLAEAMALGLPVVAGSHSGGVPWVLGADASGHSACGSLVDVRLADNIHDALALVFGPGYAAMSAAGRRRAASQFSPTRVAAEYAALYAQLAGRPINQPAATAGQQPAEQTKDRSS